MANAAMPTLTYEPELTGLLVVDPYNDFLSEGGKLYPLCRATLEANHVVEHMRQVLAAARAPTPASNPPSATRPNWATRSRS